MSSLRFHTDRPLFIFDLDGTLALVEHRREAFVADGNFRKFEDACDLDEPNKPVMRTMQTLKVFADVWIFSGRSDVVREKTVEWLLRYTTFTRQELDTCLVMRQDRDNRADDLIKKEFLDRMLDIDRQRLVAVFDDRNSVVEMWRRNGVPCFQVAQGNF